MHNIESADPKGEALLLDRGLYYAGEAGLYRLDPPFEDDDRGTFEFVIVSSEWMKGDHQRLCCRAFPANSSGEVIEWVQLPEFYSPSGSEMLSLAAAGYRQHIVHPDS